MARARNEKRDLAFEIYKEHKGTIKPAALAKLLEIENVNTVSKWKTMDKWDVKLGFKKETKKAGAKKGNTNAKGNKGGSAPSGNLNAFKHGNRIPPERFNNKSFLAKYMPKVTNNIMDDLENSGLSSLDLIWTTIQIQFAAIIRSQKIMHVKNNKDITKVTKKTGDYTEYEYQMAWDKQNTFIAAQSRAIRTLIIAIKNYEDILNKNYDLATEEQKLRVEKLKIEVDLINQTNKDANKYIIFEGEDQIED